MRRTASAVFPRSSVWRVPCPRATPSTASTSVTAGSTWPPPDRHLLVRDGRISITRGPRGNGFRPAVDPLFRTAALEYGSRVVGVVLSGALDAGSHGLRIVTDHGGIAVVQSAEEALVPSMPLNALRKVDVDHVISVRSMAPLIVTNDAQPLPEAGMALIGNSRGENSRGGNSKPRTTGHAARRRAAPRPEAAET